MKVRLNVYSVIHSLSSGKKRNDTFDFFCTVERIKDPQKMLDNLKSGDFTFHLREGP